MNYIPNKRTIALFHIFSPIMLILAITAFFLSYRGNLYIYIGLGIIIFDFLLNIITLFSIYNTASLKKKTITITKGLFNVKTISINRSDIYSVHMCTNFGAGFKRYDYILIELNKELNGKKTVKIFRSYIDDLEFEDLYNHLDKGWDDY